MRKKCPTCQSCCDTVMIMPRRFYHCYLCNIYYDIIEGKFTPVDAPAIMGVPKEELDKVFYKRGTA